MLLLAPRVQKFEVSIYAHDVKVLYKHEEHIIYCVCTSTWNEEMTFSFQRPLIDY